jgi:hypothetical protein
VLRRALAIFLVPFAASCATPKTIDMACDNPSNPKDSPTFVIDNVNSHVAGATRVWTFNEHTIEWQDKLGYTYSLDRDTGQMHRVYPRFNVGYMFDCHPTARHY